MSHDLPPSSPQDPETVDEPDTPNDPTDLTPEPVSPHHLPFSLSLLRGLELDDWRDIPVDAAAKLKDATVGRIGAAIVSRAFNPPGQGILPRFRPKRGEKRTTRQPWYKYSQKDDQEPGDRQ